MPPAARSLFAFSIYVLAASASFLVAPSTMVGLLRLPPVGDGWIRVVGLMGLVIGAYDLVGSRANLLPYIRASVWTRAGFAAGMTLLVALGQMPPTALGFAIMDAAGAAWTAKALHHG